MSSQGYHLALENQLVRQLLSKQEDLAILEYVNQLLSQIEDCGSDSVLDSHKEWDVLHRCLVDAPFAPSSAQNLLNKCFLGGRLLISEGSIVNLVMPNEVRAIANSISRLNKDWFVARFAAVFSADYPSGIPETDSMEYYQRFNALQQFYDRAANDGKAVIFYTDDSLSDFSDKDPPELEKETS